VFRQRASHTFVAEPDAILGNGGIGQPEAVATADLDGDGDADLVCASPATDRLAIFLRRSDGAYSADADSVFGDPVNTNGPVAVACADFDQDGLLDIGVANRDGNRLVLFLQQPSHSFTPTPQVVLQSPETAAPGGIVAADVDRDGDMDVISASSTNDVIAVFLQSSPGVFGPAPDVSVQDGEMIGPACDSVGDVDRDGEMDIVTANSGSANVTAFTAIRPRVWSQVPIVAGAAVAHDDPSDVRVHDIDGDGDADIILSDRSTDTIAIFFNCH
jgi:hypothetical protein